MYVLVSTTFRTVSELKKKIVLLICFEPYPTVSRLLSGSAQRSLLVWHSAICQVPYKLYYLPVS